MQDDSSFSEQLRVKSEKMKAQSSEMERGSLNYSPAAPPRPIPPINPITLIIPIFKSFSP